MRTLSIAGASLLLIACAADADSAGSSAQMTTGGISTATATGNGPPGATSAGVGSGGSAGADAASVDGSVDAGSAGDGSSGATTASDPTGTNPPQGPVDCGGTIYACGDGKDNDGDGMADLLDPECTGPCDDDESSFQTGIPGDNVDCKQDCFFDGNSGQGDDGCIWDLRCDPENPGANIGCEYTGGPACNNQSPNQDQDCIDFCGPLVPPGCDCFGCCLITDPKGNEVSIFLNSGPDCSFDNLGACQSCTQSDDCVNTCENCELCFGEETPPPGCDENQCDASDPCELNADCPQDWYCLQQCCYPPLPEG